MITAPRPITDEPVRGVPAPPWLKSLAGIERMRLYGRRLLPSPPFSRLTGLGIVPQQLIVNQVAGGEQIQMIV